MKWQLGPLPGDVDLSVTAGAALPTGTTRLTGTSTQPYLQLPWSREIGGGWGVSGMLTAFLLSGKPRSDVTIEPTFAVDRELGAHAGAFRFTPTQQVDFHVGAGLDHAAPAYIIGVGYSIRFDGLF